MGKVHVVSIGVRSDSTINVDFKQITTGDEEAPWYSNNLTIQQAEFLQEEIEFALLRVKSHKQSLTITEPGVKHPKADLTVANTNVRDSIPVIRRTKGMRVYVTNLQKMFILSEGFSNKDWVEE